MAATYIPYSEYSTSNTDWLGDIPSSWNSVRIGKLFRRIKRTGHAEEELLSVYRDYGVIPKSSRDDNFNKPSEDLSPYQLVKVNDLVMNKMKAWQGSIAVSEYKGIVSPAYFVYQPLPALFEQAYPKYIHYLLRNPVYVSQYLRRSKGIRVNQWDLDPEEFQRIELLLPDKDSQRIIYEFLDHETAKIDTLIEKQQQLIRLLKEKRQAVISHAVTKGLNPDAPMRDSGVEWLGEVPKYWSVTRVGFHASKIGSGKTPRGGSDIYQENGILFLRSQNVYDEGLRINNKDCVYISNSIHNEMAGTKVIAGDVLLNITGGSIGRTCLVPSPFIEANVNQHVCILRFAPDVSEFISYVIKSDHIKKQIEACQVGGNREGLNFEQISKLTFCLPPSDERDAIVDHVKKINNKYDEVVNRASCAVDLLIERRAALISAAVTGKIDVRNWQAPKAINNMDARL